MTQKYETGRKGEDLACKYLLEKGYKVIERNHRQKWGEIDIVCLAKDKTLVLVEVKTVIGGNPRITAEDQMSSAKIYKFKKIALGYATNYLKDSDKGFRLDLLAINLIGNDCRIQHYENI